MMLNQKILMNQMKFHVLKLKLLDISVVHIVTWFIVMKTVHGVLKKMIGVVFQNNVNLNMINVGLLKKKVTHVVIIVELNLKMKVVNGVS